MNAPGEELYRLVQDYAFLAEHHRTGLPADAATIAWFSDALRHRGATVEVVPYSFQRFEAQCRLTAGQEEIPCFPLYYEATGRRQAERLFVRDVPVDFAAGPPRLDEVLSAAHASRAEAVVIATCGATGDLVVPNRAPRRGSGLPTVLVPGREGPGLKDKPLPCAGTFRYGCRPVG